MEQASRQSGAWWFIRSNQPGGQRGWSMGGMERERRQSCAYFRGDARGECEMATCALCTRMDEDRIWRSRSAIVRRLGRDRARGYGLNLPRATVRGDESDDEHGHGYHAGKPNAASFQPGWVLRRDHRGPDNRLDRACHAKLNNKPNTGVVARHRRDPAYPTMMGNPSGTIKCCTTT